MDGSARFQLRVTAYTPKTIPLGRLAEYMQGMSALFGNQSAVHFGGLSKGSTVITAVIEQEFVAPVERRLQLVSTEDSPADVAKAIARLETLMREDGARGMLSRDGERIIKFLGIDAVVADRIGPIREATTLEGELVRIGGRDRTLHALIVSPEGAEYRVSTTNREQAKALAVHLFSIVRASGTGSWLRSEAGVWELEELRLESFEPVVDRSLADAVSELRAIEDNGWSSFADPLAQLRGLRKH